MMPIGIERISEASVTTRQGLTGRIFGKATLNTPLGGASITAGGIIDRGGLRGGVSAEFWRFGTEEPYTFPGGTVPVPNNTRIFLSLYGSAMTTTTEFDSDGNAEHGFAGQAFEKGFALPVNPQEIEISRDAEPVSREIIGLGETIIKKAPKLRRLTLESYFPNELPDPMSNPDVPIYYPTEYDNRITSFMLNKDVLQLQIISTSEITKTVTITEFPVIITKYSRIDRGGEIGDIYYSLSLTEYRAPRVVLLEEVKIKEDEPKIEEPKKTGKRQDIKCGDFVVVNGVVDVVVPKKAVGNICVVEKTHVARNVVGRIVGWDPLTKTILEIEFTEKYGELLKNSGNAALIKEIGR